MKNIFLVLSFVLMFCAGCQKNNSFVGKEYKLQNTENDAVITIAFSNNDNKFFGKAINNFFGNYDVKNNQIKFNYVGSTMMMVIIIHYI